MKNEPSPSPSDEEEESLVLNLRAAKRIRIGLTGSYGSGKSTVAALLESAIPVLHADEISKQILRSDPAITEAVRRAFGEGVLTSEGRIDEAALARLVFPNPSALERLTRILHPPTISRLQKEREALFQLGHKAVCIESAIIYESGLEEFFDIIIAVVADPERIRERLMEKKGISEEQIEIRLARQWDPTRKAGLADFTVTNNGDEAALARAVRGLLLVLRSVYHV